MLMLGCFLGCWLAGAVRAYCAGQLFDKARLVAGKSLPLQKIVEDSYTAHLVQNQNADELASRGNAGHVRVHAPVKGSAKANPGGSHLFD